MLAWTVLWIGGCADSDVRKDEQAPESEPAGRSEIVILTPADSVSVPAGTSDASDTSDTSDASDASDTGDTDDTSDANPVFFDPDGQFTVQVGVYRDAKRADQKVRELKDEGYPAYSVQSDAGVRVRIGYFSNRADANRFGRIFARDRGVEYWIARRADE
ncbi:MAG: SPOR domain-containing protein [Gemmatimonadetes bacterium]|nr:SPOR domain-containing protein [Gemmatimonadota bacterium]